MTSKRKPRKSGTKKGKDAAAKPQAFSKNAIKSLQAAFADTFGTRFGDIVPVKQGPKQKTHAFEYVVDEFLSLRIDISITPKFKKNGDNLQKLVVNPGVRP